MNVDTDLEELVSRCLAVVVCYYHFARKWSDWAAIVDKIHAIAEDAEASDVPFEWIRPLLLVELFERFDRETADRLSREFSDMFMVVSASSPAIVGLR